MIKNRSDCGISRIRSISLKTVTDITFNKSYIRKTKYASFCNHNLTGYFDKEYSIYDEMKSTLKADMEVGAKQTRGIVCFVSTSRMSQKFFD